MYLQALEALVGHGCRQQLRCRVPAIHEDGACLTPCFALPQQFRRQQDALLVEKLVAVIDEPLLVLQVEECASRGGLCPRQFRHRTCAA
jgi:hypothetical protein